MGDFFNNINGDSFALGTGFLGILALLMAFILNGISKNISNLIDNNSNDSQQISLKDFSEDLETWKLVSYYLTILFFGVFMGYGFLKGSPYQGHVLEWMNLVLRWMHMVFGIAWIGASFYFIFLEMALNRKDGIRDELAGNLWAIHGGGFYFLEKYKVSPKEVPKDLHWFKYEAYFTWITGFLLLSVVYYFNAQSMLIDPSVAVINTSDAIYISLGSLVVSWFFYDILCKSPIGKNNILFLAIMFIYIGILSYFLAQYLSARAAYMHVGAALGTIMAANVFFTIIPGQKALVASAKSGGEVDGSHAKRAQQRSLHNNYFTLPVMFVMISNHFPSTFGNKHQWLILVGLSLASVLIKHWLNLKDQGVKTVWLLPSGIALMIALMYFTAPVIITCEDEEQVSFTEVSTIIQNRCVSCHSANPTDDIFKAAPNGSIFETPEQIAVKVELIKTRVVTKSMPLGNKTGMTQEERDKIEIWYCQGAKTK